MHEHSSQLSNPAAILIAGPNGAGKTTFAREMIPFLHPGVPFLNADEIQRESLSLRSATAAAKELLRRLDVAELSSASFAVETTLASTSYRPRVRRWSAAGFRTVLHFIELPSADFAVERVRARVTAGGHNIPEIDVRRRFTRGRKLFLDQYKETFDVWYHWFSNDDGLRLHEEHPAPEADALTLLLEVARRATWDAKHGPAHLRSGRFFIAAHLDAHASSRLVQAAPNPDTDTCEY